MCVPAALDSCCVSCLCLQIRSVTHSGVKIEHRPQTPQSPGSIFPAALNHRCRRSIAACSPCSGHCILAVVRAFVLPCSYARPVSCAPLMPCRVLIRLSRHGVSLTCSYTSNNRPAALRSPLHSKAFEFPETDEPPCESVLDHSESCCPAA